MSTTKTRGKKKLVEIVVSDDIFRQEILKNPKVGAKLSQSTDKLVKKINSAASGKFEMEASELKSGKTRTWVLVKSVTKGAKYVEAKYGFIIKALLQAGMKVKK